MRKIQKHDTCGVKRQVSARKNRVIADTVTCKALIAAKTAMIRYSTKGACVQGPSPSTATRGTEAA